MWAARASDLFKNLPCSGRWRKSHCHQGKRQRRPRPSPFPCPNANKAVSSMQRGNCLLFFPPDRSLHFSASLSSAATPSFIDFPAKKTNLRTRKKRSSFQHGATGERDTFLTIQLQSDGAPFPSGNSGAQPIPCSPFHSKSPRFPKTSLSFIFNSFLAPSDWTWKANCVIMRAPFSS